MNYIIKTKNLTKYYRKKLALNNVSVNIPKGSVYGLLGPNGAGKTTFIGVLSGFVRKTSGNVLVGSYDIDKDIQKVRNSVGLLPQDALLYNNMTAIQHMTYFGRLQGLSKAKAFNSGKELLKKVGLTRDMDVVVRKLSHGLRRRLGIAQALIGNPKILILDEPTSGLDPLIAANVRSLVRKLKDENVTIIFCSHNLYEVEELCDHIGILDRGKLVKEGKISALKKSKVLTVTFNKISKEDKDIIKKIGKRSYVEKVMIEGKEVRIVITQGSKSSKVMKLLVDSSLDVNTIKKGSSLEEEFVEIVE
ncbi:ABC transporter ATP-binding protein [Candidatus Woesearchaeota archaeon]|nr:ABC transporter ATP-binding protein [Candidatus Woesearchaeota archaeon]